MKSIADILARRAQLVSGAAAQRGSLGVFYSSLQGPASLVDRGAAFVEWLRRRPLIAGAIAAALVALRPRGALKLAGRGLVAWRALRMIREFLKAMGANA